MKLKRFEEFTWKGKVEDEAPTDEPKSASKREPKSVEPRKKQPQKKKAVQIGKWKIY